MQNDPVWQRLRSEAEATLTREPVLAELLRVGVLNRNSLEEALSYRLPRKLGHHAVSADYLQQLFLEIFLDDPIIGARVREDLLAVHTRDPACQGVLHPYLYYKGFQSLATYRLAHYLYGHGRRELAYYLQSIVSENMGVDIHPAARIGAGILFDHATSIVVGETAVIEDNVSILHEVTLGGTGKEKGDRHPKIRQGVLIGAGAKLLGNIEIGEGARIGAGSVVLDSVPPHSTVVGVPAKVVGKTKEDTPALNMEHRI